MALMTDDTAVNPEPTRFWCDLCYQEVIGETLVEGRRPFLRYWHKDCASPEPEQRATSKEILAWYEAQGLHFRLCDGRLQKRGTTSVETLERFDREMAQVEAALRKKGRHGQRA